MTQNNEFLAGLLRGGARAFAGYAAQGLLEEHPDTKQGFEPDPFAGWQKWLAVRLEELAVAAAMNRPQLFVRQVEWGRAVLGARGVDAQDLRRALLSLREVLEGELPDQVRQMAVEYLDQAIASFDKPLDDLSVRLLPDTELGRLASRYLLFLLEGDRREASRLVLEALDRGQAVRDLYLHVLLPAQEELGRMWLANEINVAEEHFASQTTKAVMAQLLPKAKMQPANGKTIIAACVPGNRHDIGLGAVADFFEMDGWRTVLLGADVPVRDLVQAADCFSADLLALSVSQATQISSAKESIETVRSVSQNRDVKILLGGRALDEADELADELGADGHASDPQGAVESGKRLLGLD